MGLEPLFIKCGFYYQILKFNDFWNPQPIVTNDSSSYYENPDGIIFLTVETAGDELAQIKKYEDYFVIQQDDVYGFLNLDLENNGKSLVGDFYSNNDDEIIDHFELTKTS